VAAHDDATSGAIWASEDDEIDEIDATSGAIWASEDDECRAEHEVRYDDEGEEEEPTTAPMMPSTAPLTGTSGTIGTMAV
jgi:hypothetical protein